MRTALIVGAAPAPGHDAFYAALLSGDQVVIAADAAGEWCVSLGRVPDITAGDFDSAAPGAQDRLAAMGSRIAEVPRDKDISDLDACVREARLTGVDAVRFTAAFTGRMDHTLAALGAVMRAADLDAQIREPSWSAYSVDGVARPRLLLQTESGSTFSVMAPGGAGGVTIQGGKYAMHARQLEPLSSLALSNVATDATLEVAVQRGSALVIVQEEPL